MSNFLRKYKLQITASNGDSRVITDLQIEFTITKLTDSNMNSMDLSLYNINEKTKGVLNYDKDTLITLHSSHRNGTWDNLNDDEPLELLFQGTVFNTPTVRNGPDVITQIKCKDGNVPIREARSSRQWPEGVILKQIIIDLVTNHFIGISIGEVFGEPLNKIFQNGYSTRGAVKKSLDNLTSTNQLQWNITDGIFNVFPKNKTLQQGALIVKNVLGTPETVFQEPDQLRNTTDISNPNGIKFKVLLNPKFKPGRKLDMQTINIKGEFKTEKITHKGSYMGNLWETEIQAVRV